MRSQIYQNKRGCGQPIEFSKCIVDSDMLNKLYIFLIAIFTEQNS